MTKDNTPILNIKTPSIKAEENSESQDSSISNGHREERSSRNDPFNQLETFRLFSYFTTNIIQEDVIFIP